MVNSLAGIVLASVSAVGIVGGSVGVLAYASRDMNDRFTYGSKEADALAKAADTNKDGVLQTKELADLLKELGYAGAPIPDGAFPQFQVGGTKELKVTALYVAGGSRLSVAVPNDSADAYLEKHK